MNKKLLAIPVLGLALVTGGCARMGSHGAVVGSASAQAHAVASSSAGTLGKEIVRKCVPQNPIAEASWFSYMASGKNSKHALKGTQTREAFAACAGIPPAKMAAFENKALTDAEAAASSALSPSVTLKSAAKGYLETTLPEDVVKYRG